MTLHNTLFNCSIVNENMHEFHAKFVCFVVVYKSFFTYLKTTISPSSLYIMTVFLSLFSSFFFLYLYIRDIMVPKYHRWYHGTKKEKGGIINGESTDKSMDPKGPK